VGDGNEKLVPSWQGQGGNGGNSKGDGDAKRNMISVPIVGTTIPTGYPDLSGGARVLLNLASEGSQELLLAVRCVRVLETAGVRDVLTKSLGSANPINVVRATIEGLSSFENG